MVEGMEDFLGEGHSFESEALLGKAVQGKVRCGVFGECVCLQGEGGQEADFRKERIWENPVKGVRMRRQSRTVLTQKLSLRLAWPCCSFSSLVLGGLSSFCVRCSCPGQERRPF